MQHKEQGPVFVGQRGPAVEEIKLLDMDEGTFEGYGSVFDEVDRGGDIVERGAFSASLSARPAARVKMLWQHNPSEVIGKWLDMAEDSRGLHVKGRLFDTAKGREAKLLLKEGAVDGLSIGYRVQVDEYDRAGDVRHIKQADLLEVSVVTFPMNEAATITAVKSGDDLPTERQFERFLRDAGFSARESKAIIADGFRSLTTVRDAEAAEMAEAKARLLELAAKLRG